MRRLITIMFILLFSSTQAIFGQQQRLKVLCSIFPIYQITRNVTQGANIQVKLMLPASLGCPHNYMLAPRDMYKLARADVLVINGQHLEEFIGAPLKRANGRLKVVDSSIGIQELIKYDNTPEHGAHGRQHQYTKINPHLFASPRMTARMALNIGHGLAKIDPRKANLYLANAKHYAAKMNKLADEFVKAGKHLSNNRIVTQHSVFDYLAKHMGLKIIAVLQVHPGQEPSAVDMIRIIHLIRAKKAGAIFSEPQYPDNIARMVAHATGIVIAKLDPVATGPDNAPLDYYENVMKENLKTIKKTLGEK